MTLEQTTRLTKAYFNLPNWKSVDQNKVFDSAKKDPANTEAVISFYEDIARMAAI